MNENKNLYFGWLGILSVLLLIGIYTMVKLFSQGHWLFNTNDVIIWSLPLCVYIFLALTSSGLTILSAIPTVFGLKRYQPFAKLLIFLAIATLCGGFVAISLELGNVWQLFYIMLSPNFSSPIWWMGFIYSVELVVLGFKFWRLHIGDWNSGFSKVLGNVSLICAIIAPLMIGSVFGITESRATYFGPMMSVYCLAMAFLSGNAFFILYSTVCNKLTGNGSIDVHADLYDEFCVIFKYAAGAVIILTLLKSAVEATTVVPEFLSIRSYKHPFGPIFGFHLEVLLGLFFPFILLLIPSIRKTINGKMIIGAIATIGAMGIHMQILIAGQSHPIGPKAEQYANVLGYFPSIWEWLVALFAFTIMLFLFTIGERYLNLQSTSS